MSCNFNEFQYCLCVSSMWKFQSVMFQQIDSRTSCVFSHPGEIRIERKNWSRWKKFNYWPLSSENLTDLWFQLSRKIEKSQTRWHLSHVIQKPKTTLQTWTLRVMCSFRGKTTTAELVFFIFDGKYQWSIEHIMSEAKVHTENEDAEHKNLSKKSRKVTNISVLRVITEKFTKELNVLWCKFTRENENKRTSNESDKRWCESNLEELMSVKPLHCVEAYIFSNQSFFYKCTAFT